MTCRKVLRLIPLAAGEDLGPRQADALRAHLASCPGCRAELEAFRQALAAIKAEVRAESPADWSPREWRALMRRVAAEAKAGAGRARAHGGSRPGSAFRPRWAAAAAAGAALGLAVMAILFRGPSAPRRAAEGLTAAAGVTAGQDQMSITLISPESGLQVVWILDRNFEWKGDLE